MLSYRNYDKYFLLTPSRLLLPCLPGRCARCNSILNPPATVVFDEPWQQTDRSEHIHPVTMIFAFDCTSHYFWGLVKRNLWTKKAENPAFIGYLN